MTSQALTRRIFLLGNATKPSVNAAFSRMAAWLDDRRQLAGSDLDGKPERVNDSDPEFVIAMGGDGTILHAVQAMQKRQVPIVGVNMGKLGYLADFDENEVYQSLDALLDRPELVSRRLMFDVTIESPKGDQWSGVALNDCVIRVGDPFRTVLLEIHIDDQPLCTLAGDGVILATPTGSTAHNMSCGGPIVESGADAIIVTPRCAHSFTHRPVVVSGRSKVSVRVMPQSVGASVVLDGQCVRPVTPDARIRLVRSACDAQLVRNPKRRLWDTLISKLKWGVDVT